MAGCCAGNYSAEVTEIANVLKAAYEIPVCVSFVFLVVQALRVTLSDVLDRLVRSCEDQLEQR
jgi:hypothetical protein